MDPGPIPKEIKELKNIERRFISLIHVFMTVFLLPQHQQMATKGIAINIPASPSELMGLAGISPGIFVSFQSRSGTDHDLSHIISTERIYNALVWLKHNNKLYANIELPEVQNDTQNMNSCEFYDLEECAAINVNEHVPFE